MLRQPALPLGDRAYVLCLFAFVPINTFSLFYAKSLNMRIDLYGKLLALTELVSFILGLLACLSLYRKFMAMGGPIGCQAPE